LFHQSDGSPFDQVASACLHGGGSVSEPIDAESIHHRVRTEDHTYTDIAHVVIPAADHLS
jgi:hypothetical protein